MNEQELQDENVWDTLKKISAGDLSAGSLSPIEAGKPVSFQTSKTLLSDGDIYFFAMKAFDDANQISPVSSTSKLVLDLSPPNKVSDLKAELLDLIVQISFTAPGDDDNEGIGKYHPFLK